MNWPDRIATMKLFSRPTSLRHAASLMLALWVFALASGFANACLLENPASVAHRAAVEIAYAPGTPGHAEAAAHHALDSSRATCLKACDEGSQALQAAAGGSLLDPGSAPLAAMAWPRLPDASVQYRAADPHPPLADPPERIRYSRWAL
jgi:hypothetical protein